MTISAAEARKLAQSSIEERNAKMFGKIDSMIDAAIYECQFSITTPILSKPLANDVTEYYSNLGYEITDYNNNMLGIGW